MSTDAPVDALREKCEALFAEGKTRQEVATFLHEQGSSIAAVLPGMSDIIPDGLLPHHKHQLCIGSGLTLETLKANNVHSETNAPTLKTKLHWPRMAARGACGIVFEFTDIEGNNTGFCRFKPDNPRQDRDGKIVKYEAPRGIPNRTYFPVSTIPVLRDVNVRLLITEGEKKSLKASQEGFPCIGLTGVFAWKQKKNERLIPDLEAIEWKGREVVIGFDSDIAEKPQVADAESRLAAQLVQRGAIVRCVRFPAGPDGSKVGLDDFLVANPPAELHKLINAAQEPEPVDGGYEKCDAACIDAMKEANSLIALTATHIEGAESFSKLRSHREEYLWYTGTRYRVESPGDVKSKVVNFLDNNYCRLNTTAVANVMLCLKAVTNVSSHVEMPSWLDGQTGQFIPLQNGILNINALVRGEAKYLLPHSPRYFSTNCLPYQFDENADCPKWKSFLDRNLEGDVERITILQQFCGNCLSPHSAYQKFLFNEGEGANGKSVFCAVLSALLGLDNVSSVPLETFGDRFALSTTIGKFANIASEVGEIDRVAEGILKAYTTGDAIQFDRKHKDPITARPTAKLVFASNNRPRFSDKSGGLWRRMILMPWRIIIPEAERIPGMDKPQYWVDSGELPGILLWAITGLWQLEQQGGFSKSSICEAALSEYRSDSNPSRCFLEEHFRFEPEQWTPCDELYKSYIEWMKGNGFVPLSAGSLGHEIRRAFPSAIRNKRMVAGVRFFTYDGLEKR